jgi:ABC-2 type transport system ATP-binding protein
MIEVNNLTKRYGDFTAISDLSFSVPKGVVTGLLGPNGAGKSTTMKILSGFMPSTSGTATVAGFNVQDDAMEVKKRVGYLPEDPPLYVDMRVADYLAHVAALKQVEKSKISERVDYVMGRCGLKDRARQVISTLSKGYKQRVGIAQALVHDPEVVILDEPTVGLDPVQIREIRDLIKDLAGNHTVILSTHILPEVTMTCSHAVIINHGKVLHAGTIDSFTTGDAHNLEEAYIRLISTDRSHA